MELEPFILKEKITFPMNSPKQISTLARTPPATHSSRTHTHTHTTSLHTLLTLTHTHKDTHTRAHTHTHTHTLSLSFTHTHTRVRLWRARMNSKGLQDESQRDVISGEVQMRSHLLPRDGSTSFSPHKESDPLPYFALRNWSHWPHFCRKGSSSP